MEEKDNKKKKRIGQVDPLEDRVFKAVFSLSDEARVSFVSAIVGRKVESVTVANPILSIADKGAKECRLDMHCVLDDGTVCAVEVQSSGQARELIPRCLSYWASLFALQVRKGEDHYRTVHEVWQVMILRKGVLFPGSPGAVSVHSVTDRKTGRETTSLLHLVFAELEKLDGEAPPCALNDWLVYLKEGWRDEETVMRLEERTKGIRAAWEVGMTIAEEKGFLKVEKQMRQRDLAIMRNEADKKGERRGIKKGKQEGGREEQERIIHTMMANGMPMNVIATSLGLPESDILRLMHQKEDK